MINNDQNGTVCEYCDNPEAISSSLGAYKLVLCQSCWQLEMGDFTPVVKGTLRCMRKCRGYAEVTCTEDDVDLCFKHMRDHNCRNFEEGFIHVLLHQNSSKDVLVEYDFFRHRILISEGDAPPDRDNQEQMTPYLKSHSLNLLEEVLQLSEDKFALLILKKLTKAIVLHDQILGDASHS